MISGLFSIDLQTQLDKLARSTHSTPAYGAVEWVRLAIHRQATTIDVRITDRSLRIADDGTGLSPREWRALRILTDPDQPLLAREQALTSLRDPLGIGLLGMFACKPARITLDDTRNKGAVQLLIEHGSSSFRPLPPRAAGTVLLVEREARWSPQERDLLHGTCRNAAVRLVVDGQPLVRQPIPPEALVTQELDSPSLCRQGLLILPGSGDSCRVQLTDGGIPWFTTALPPVGGLLFDARLERDRPLDEAAIARLATAATEFFAAMVEHFAGYSDLVKQRLERVLILRHRLSGDLSLLRDLPLFAAATSTKRHSLAELTELARDRELVAMWPGGPTVPEEGGGLVLLRLDPQQIDFLRLGARLPLRFPQAVPEKPHAAFPPPGRWTWLRRLGVPLARIRSRRQESPAERALLEALRQELARQSPTGTAGAIVARRAWTVAPGWREAKHGRIVLNLAHPLTRKASALYADDPAHIEWLAGVLVE